jgi:hypothetical protein
MALLSSAGRLPPFQVDVGLNVKGNSHGIKEGWFNWPLDYDPRWLLECDGFEAKEHDEHIQG